MWMHLCKRNTIQTLPRHETYHEIKLYVKWPFLSASDSDRELSFVKCGWSLMLPPSHFFKSGVCPVAYLYANDLIHRVRAHCHAKQVQMEFSQPLSSAAIFWPHKQIQTCISGCVHLEVKERLSLYIGYLQASVPAHCGTGLFNT